MTTDPAGADMWVLPRSEMTVFPCAVEHRDSHKKNAVFDHSRSFWEWFYADHPASERGYKKVEPLVRLTSLKRWYLF